MQPRRNSRSRPACSDEARLHSGAPGSSPSSRLAMPSGAVTRMATTFAGLVAATISFGMAGQASAGTVCTQGDANAMLQAQPVATQVMLPRGQDHPGLLDAAQHCQYRLF